MPQLHATAAASLPSTANHLRVLHIQHGMTRHLHCILSSVPYHKISCACLLCNTCYSVCRAPTQLTDQTHHNDMNCTAAKLRCRTAAAAPSVLPHTGMYPHCCCPKQMHQRTLRPMRRCTGTTEGGDAPCLSGTNIPCRPARRESRARSCPAPPTARGTRCARRARSRGPAPS